MSAMQNRPGGPRPFMGGDSNGNSGGRSERTLSFEFSGSQIRLDSSWTFKAQIHALNLCNAAPDMQFKEYTIKDVSDNARMRGAAFLQEALHQVHESAMQLQKKKRKGQKIVNESGKRQRTAAGGVAGGVAGMSKADVQRDASFLVQELKRHRSDPAGPVRDAMIVDVLQQLEEMPISLGCLKKTKLAIELNDAFWKGPQVSAGVREQASALMRHWRSMYREEVGHTPEAEVNSSARARQCRNLSMDLEESAYNISQSAKKLDGYADLLEGIGACLRQNLECAQALITGTKESRDFVAAVSAALQRQRESHRQRLINPDGL